MNIPITEEDGAGEANPEAPKSAEGEDKPDLATMPAGGDNPQWAPGWDRFVSDPVEVSGTDLHITDQL